MMTEPYEQEVDGIFDPLCLQCCSQTSSNRSSTPRELWRNAELQNFRLQARLTESDSSLYQDSQMIFMHTKVLEALP